MKATEQYFHLIQFIMLYKVVLTFKSVDKTLVCDHSNESYWAVLSCGTVYYALQGISNFFRSVDETNQMMATEQFFHVVLFIILYVAVLALMSAYKNLSVWIYILNVIEQSVTIHLLAQNSSTRTSPTASLVAPCYQTHMSLHVAIKVHLCCFNLSCTRYIYIHMYNPCKSIYKLKPAIQTQAV